ncbi:MAG: hypothetical protein NVSMB52_12380 [Chloroflexota bacterium]
MPVLLLHGDNPLEIGDALRSLRDTFNAADVVALHGPSVPLPTLSVACLTAGLFDPERLVVVHDLQDRLKNVKKDSTEWEELTRILGSVAPTTTLILVSPGMAADHTLVYLARSIGAQVKAYMTPRRQELPRWIMSRAKNHGTSIDGDAADLLADLAGANPVLLDSELEKLATYAGGERRITQLMVDTLVGAVPQDSIFKLVDAIAVGDKPLAFRLLHTQLEVASSNPIEAALYLIRMLARQMRILLRIRLGQEGGKTTSRLTSDLNLPRYHADKYFQQARRLPKDRLRDSFEHLAALEHGLKSGKAEAGTGLDLLLAELCR